MLWARVDLNSGNMQVIWDKHYVCLYNKEVVLKSYLDVFYDPRKQMSAGSRDSEFVRTTSLRR